MRNFGPPVVDDETRLLSSKWGVAIADGIGNLGDVSLVGGSASLPLVIHNHGHRNIWLKKITGVEPPFSLCLNKRVRLPLFVRQGVSMELGYIVCKGVNFFGSTGVSTCMLKCTFESERMGDPYWYSVECMKIGLRLKVCSVDNSNMYRSRLNPVASSFVPNHQLLVKEAPALRYFIAEGFLVDFHHSNMLHIRTPSTFHNQYFVDWFNRIKSELTEFRNYMDTFTLYDLQIPKLKSNRNYSTLELSCPMLFEDNLISIGDKVVIRNDNPFKMYELRCTVIETIFPKKTITIQLPILKPRFIKVIKASNSFQIRFTRSETFFVNALKALESVAANEALQKQLFIPENVDAQDIDIKPKEVKFEWEDKFTWKYSNINEEQKLATVQFLGGTNTHPYIISGPPGTGKTVTVIEILVQIAIRERVNKSVVLGCAPSDAAADILAHRLSLFLRTAAETEKFKLIRLNQPSRSFAQVSYRDTVLQHCVVDTSTGLFTVPPDSALVDGTIPTIIISTCRAAALLFERRIRPDYILIDESAQASEIEALIPISLASSSTKIVLCGDSKQLGPKTHIRSFGNTLDYRLEKVYRSHIPLRVCFRMKLVKNYRSHPYILRIFSDTFYRGKLESCVEKSDKMDRILGWKDTSTVFISHSKGQKNEYSIVKETIESLEKLIDTDFEISCIVPFREEAVNLRRTLREQGLGRIQVGTVHDYQGQEKDVVIFSTFNSIHDHRALNVALSRAKSLLIVVGNPFYLSFVSRIWIKVFKLFHVWEGKEFNFDKCLQAINLSKPLV